MDDYMDRDWTALPQDILLIAMAAMEVPDIVHSAAVCSAWRTAYALFRRLRLPTPKQPPCLLYACEDYGADAAALYSPSSSTTFRVPFPGAGGHNIHGSAHGWLFIVDEAANPYLLNPLTAARAALPPFSTLRRVTGSFSDGAATTYAIDYGRYGAPDVRRAKASKAALLLCDHVAISTVGEGGACVVLLLHTFYAELSFARTGDERWTSLSSGLDAEPRAVRFPDLRAVGAAHNDCDDGLFYLIGDAGGVYALDLRVRCPVSRPLVLEIEDAPGPLGTHYLVFNSSGQLLLVWRRCTVVPSPRAEIISSNGRTRKAPARNHSIATAEIGVYKVDVDKKRLVRLTGVGDNAIFLGRNSAVCLPICEYPMLSPNCAYLTTDNTDDILDHPIRRDDIGIWNLESQSMHKLGHAWPLPPWLHTTPPVWITPSLY